VGALAARLSTPLTLSGRGELPSLEQVPGGAFLARLLSLHTRLTFRQNQLAMGTLAAVRIADLGAMRACGGALLPREERPALLGLEVRVLDIGRRAVVRYRAPTRIGQQVRRDPAVD
jgi:hypothetical protein